MKQYRSLFGNRNFLLLWLGGAISNIGDFFSTMALLKILSQEPTHLGFYLSLIMIAQMVPRLLLGPVAGVVADRVSRRAILVVSDLLRAGLVTALVFTGNSMTMVGLVFLSSAVSTFFNPAHAALLPNLVAEGELVSANSLVFVTSRTAQLLGNALGAAALMVMSVHHVFYLDAVSFLVSGIATALLRLPAAGARQADAAPTEAASTKMEPADTGAVAGVWGKFRADLAETVLFLRGAQVIRRLLGVFALSAVGDSSLNLLLFSFFTIGLGLAAEQYGFAMALFGATSVVGGLAIGGLGERVHWRHFVSYGSLSAWALLFVALVIHQPLPSVALMVVMGLGSGAINVGANTAFGTQVPDHVRGRISSTWSMIQSGIYIVGVLIAGNLSDRFGPTNVLIGFSLSFLLMGLYALFAFRSLRQGAPAPAALAESGRAGD